jgi:putative PLP-dependent aminotransferase (TIGR04422 family)
LEAVSHICTPVTIDAKPGSISAALVYHQWGHVHQACFAPEVRIIEDSVDSLLMPGRSPFVANGHFVLWSLPKVLATQSGGVVFCRSRDDADELRCVRAQRRSSALQAFLRLKSKTSAIAALYWNGAEAMQGTLVSPLRRQVLRRLRTIEQVIDQRLTLLQKLSSQLRTLYESSGRLPSNLPLHVPANSALVWAADGPVTSGLRSFNLARRSPNSQWMKVAPLPVHLDVSWPVLQELLKLIGMNDGLEQGDLV